jgi:hypothetical protein
MNKMTMTGCLQQGQNGNYMLRDETGKEVMISGGEKLSKHVNHTVKVTGKYTDYMPKASTTTEETPNSTSHGSGGHQNFKVSKIEHVSDTCTNSSSNSSTPSQSPRP